MPNELSVPDDLMHMLEKRQEDRRKSDRRQDDVNAVAPDVER